MPAGLREIRLFSKVRNEARRLPYFFEHHRELGVERFFLVDNGSTDGTVALALDQPDVHVFETVEPLSRHGLWLEALLGEFGADRWCVVADADELLVLPSLDALSLREFIGFMEQARADALSAVLLDLYPRHPLAPGTYEAGEDPRQYCDHFDAEFTSAMTRRFNPRRQRWFDTVRFAGGTRQRVFGVDVNLTKFPLFRYGAGMWLSPGAHALDGASIAQERGAMLHFKYLDDFVDRTAEGARRGVYADGGGYYSSIAAQLERPEEMMFWCDGSQRLTDPADLLALGVLRSSADLHSFVHRRRHR